jgi:hypothetical protein
MEGTPMGTEMGKIVRRFVLACLLPLAGVGSGLAQLSEQDARERAEKFADQVVRVIPRRTDGTPAPAGFGLVVGDRAGKVYIATPYHVAFGPDRPSSVGVTPGIVFRGDRYNTIQARRMDIASPQPDDLAVIEVAPPRGLALPRSPTVLAAQLRPATFVWNIGIGQDWDMPDRAGGLGPQNAVTGLRRIGQLRTPPGASGGAGVTDSGVIGIVLQDAADYSLLLPVERIVQLFTAWGLPVNLLTSPAAAPVSGDDLPAIFPETPATRVRAFEFQTPPQEVKPGFRKWTRVASDVWEQLYPDGTKQLTYTIKRINLNDCDGTVVSPKEEPDFQAFFPDKTCRKKEFMFRRLSQGKTWHSYVPINHME